VKNDEKAKQEFENRKNEARRKAIEENVKQAQKSGNKLTQTLDENGNLVGVMDTVNFEEREAAEKDTKEILEKQLKDAAERERENNA
jgi:translation elongation factor P/translation initiation factor 5A